MEMHPLAEVQQELAEELDCVILLLQTEEPVMKIEEVAAMIQEIKEMIRFVLYWMKMRISSTK